jgi:DNA-binding FadR family transcriptional regulator
MEFHRRIVVSTGNPEAARAWATVHIAGVEQWLAPVP